MRSFLVAAAALALASCAGQQPKSGTGATATEATPAPPEVPVPADCKEPAAMATTARAGDDPAEKTQAVFALAECEYLRFRAEKTSGDAKLQEIVGLYAEAIGSNLPKYVIGGHVRTGDLYLAAMGGDGGASYKQKARESYENGLHAADGTDANTRLDLDISDWVKAACKGTRQLGGQERKFKVCNPWKESWR